MNPTAFPTPIRHVLFVLLENAEASTVLAGGPYEKYLASHYAYASHYYGVNHPSAPNYLALTSGSIFSQAGTDTYHVYSSTNIGDLTQSAGLTWGAFAESMPVPCDTHDSGLYAIRHNPMPWYADVVHNVTRCATHVVDFNAWNADVALGTIPNFAFISPNVNDDGHDTGVAGADKWLKGWLPPLLNSSWFASSAIFIVYDEGKTRLGYNGTVGGNVYLTVVSPFAHAGYVSAHDYSHYNLLTTAEWLLGLGNCGHNDNPSTFPPMKDLFSFSNPPPPPKYTISGTVTGPQSLPLTGADVSATSSSTNATAVTNASGGFILQLPNGSYSLTATSPGLVSSSQPLVVSGAGVTGLLFSLVSPPTDVFPVTGKVVDSQSGTPIAAAIVTATGGIGGLYSTTTAANGSFSLTLPNGSYTMVASIQLYHPTSANISVAGAAVANLVFSLNHVLVIPKGYSVDGAVYSSPSYVSVKGAEILVNGTSTHNETTTGSNGTFSFLLTNGSYVITVLATGNHTFVTNFTVVGAPIHQFDLLIYPVQTPVYPVAGTIENSQSEAPIPGAIVTLLAANGTSKIGDSATGGFSLDLPNGTYLVAVSAPGFTTVVERILVNGGSVVGLDLSLPPILVLRLPGSPVPATGALLLAAVAIGALIGGTSFIGFRRVLGMTRRVGGFTRRVRGIGRRMRETGLRLSETARRVPMYRSTRRAIRRRIKR